MGISGLLPLLKSIHKPCSLKRFSGQTIGVDAYGWLHRGTVSCAIDLALDKPTTKFVDFAMSRVRMLIHFGIKPYLVFDGDYLPSKAGTEKARSIRRKESRKIGLELLRLGKASQAQQELQKAVDVTPEMARMLIEELKRNNIEYVVAPYEADSQLAYLERRGIINGILSEDSDLLVFGARCLITKLDQYGECVMIRRDDFTACREISLVGWTDVEFRRMAILSGCDYLASISKMGLKTAYRMIRKHKTVERTLRAIQLDSQFKVPAGYLEAFKQAEMTFLYQWVFCPVENCLVNCTDPAADVNPNEMAFIGRAVEAKVAAAVARGDLHPHTKSTIVVPDHFKSRYSGKPLLKPQRQSSIQIMDGKKTKPIQDFFKPRRIPLAELDPNSIEYSQSQLRLLERNSSSSWNASPAPAPRRSQTSRTPVSPSASPSVRSPRRAISDSWARRVSASHPSKRQRLCADAAAPASLEDTHEGEFGRSRFFTPAQGTPKSVESSASEKKPSKSEFNLWSDDSIEDAMAELSDSSAQSIKVTKSREFAVYKDQPALKLETPKPAPAESSHGDESQPSQWSASSHSTVSTESRESIGTLTPATSVGSPSPDSQPSDEASSAVSSELEGFAAKFSYTPASTRLSSGSQLRGHRSPKRAVSSKSLRGRPAPHRPALLPSSPVKNKNISALFRSETATPTSKPSRAFSHPRLSAPMVSSPSLELSLDSQDADSDPDPLPEPTVSLVPSSSQNEPDIADPVWLEAEAEVVVPGSDADLSEATIDPKAIKHTPDIPAFAMKGSEDLLVPDSETESGDELPIWKGVNLGRFKFVAG